MNPQDEALLVEFGDRADLVAGFTSQMEDIQSKLISARPSGLTAMLDAAEMALREMKKAKNPRKAVLIISDGGDNNSKYTPSSSAGWGDRKGSSAGPGAAWRRVCPTTGPCSS
jgi:Ca-activated chloride channel family protein